jgi:hypothetical protein
MRIFVARVGVAAALALAVAVTVASPATADSEKDQACTQLRKFDDDTTLTRAQTKTLARAVETLGGSHSLGAAQVVRQLRTAIRGSPNERAAALRDASDWCVGRASTPTPAPSRTFSPQHLEGNGGGLYPLQFPKDAAAIARIVANGTGHLEVTSLDASGQQLATIVSADGPYRGTRPLNFEVGNNPTQIQVAHGGPWTIDVLPVGAAARLSAPGTYRGSGDSVLAISGGSKQARFDAPAAAGSFRVDAYGTIRVSLVDSATPYSGSVIVPSEADFVLVVESPSDWSVTLG